MSQVQEVLRSMLLPISGGREVKATKEFSDALREVGVEISDSRSWLGGNVAKWKENGSPDQEFSRVITRVLSVANSDMPELQELPLRYFDIHKRLVSRPHSLTHDEASVLLSHVGLIANLAGREKMSASQIAVILSARHANTGATWKAVRQILVGLHMEPELLIEQVKMVWELDKERESFDFADAEIEASARLVSELANRLGFPSALQRWLLQLFTPRLVFVGPLLQILHYQCMIVEFYDHPATWLYEFKPRGRVAAWVYEQYPAEMGVSGNPILNNAKATPRGDLGWASTRDDATVVEATALAHILLGMEELGYAARRELAGWLRRWLIRIIRLITLNCTDSKIQFSNLGETRALLSNAGRIPSNTAGILEQRIVDAGSSLMHEQEEWQSRGLGDSVNASNVSRRKLGDCDYQMSGSHIVVAYEAHGGTLTNTYLEEHIRTLRRVLKLRQEEWDDTQWKVTVKFIAHKCNAELPKQFDIDGVSVFCEWTPFQEFCAKMMESLGLLEAMQTYLVTPVNHDRTPVMVRDKVKEWMHLEDVGS